MQNKMFPSLYTWIIQYFFQHTVTIWTKWPNSHNLLELLECVTNTYTEEKTVNGRDYGQFEIYTAKSNVYGFYDLMSYQMDPVESFFLNLWNYLYNKPFTLCMVKYNFNYTQG